MSEKLKSKLSTKGHPGVNERFGSDVLVTQTPDVPDPLLLPFPEWSDEEINSIVYSANTGSNQTRMSQSSDKSMKRSEKSDRNEEFGRGFFEDQHVLFLPFGLHDLEYDWKRVKDIFPNHHLVIHTGTHDYPDLLTQSAHILESAFMRSFISSITLLEYLGNTTNFAVEGATPKFTSIQSGPWKPWHHVYSKKTVNGVLDSQLNKVGKYYVRLFWLGAWRRVIIDDYLPVDKFGHVLLPSLPIPRLNIHVDKQTDTGQRSATPKSKEKRNKSPKPVEEKTGVAFQIWSFLLCKAVLKLANLTMKMDKDLVDFDIVHCLTGWVLQTLDLRALSSEEIWKICKSHTKEYTWKKKEEVGGEKKKLVPQGPDKKGKKGKKKIFLPDNTDGTEKAHHFILLCKDLRSAKNSTVQGLTPCWGHEIVIDECRDVPLVEPPPEVEYPLWKTFRWTQWAKSKGMITDPIPLDRTRYLKAVAPFKNFSELQVYKEEVAAPPPQSKFPLRRSIAAFANVLPERKPTKETQPSPDISEIHPTIEKTKEKTKSESPEMHQWIKFEDLKPHLLLCKIFYKPSMFSNKARISDSELFPVVQSNKKTTNKEETSKSTYQDVLWSFAIQKRNNCPLYLFVDSLKAKMLLINLNQAGDIERLTPLDEELSVSNFFYEYERLFGEKIGSVSEEAIPTKKFKLNRARIHLGFELSNAVLEKYRWNNPKVGALVSFVSTYGSGSNIFELEPGRHVLRLWIKSNSRFCCTILSDTPFTVGCLEQIMDKLAEEPMQITRIALNISESFANLIQSFGKPTFDQKLKGYFSSYLPKDANKELSKLQRSVIHDTFKRSLLQYLTSSEDVNILEQMMDTLRTLFIDVTMRRAKGTSIKSENVKKEESMQFQSLQEKLICEKSSTKLIAFFKRVQVSILIKRHQMTNRHFNDIYDHAISIYHDIFSLEKREHHLGVILRNFFNHPDMDGFLPLYEVYNDFVWDVDVDTYYGNAELTRQAVVLCRFILYCNSEIVIAFHLFCNISHHCLRIIDNDTGLEVCRFTNEVYPRAFSPNTAGYTIVGFAWSEDVQMAHWKFVVISERSAAFTHFLGEIQSLWLHTFENYTPLCQNIIGKHSIALRENVIFTLRFSCSYKNVKFNIRLYDQERKLLVDLYGTERIILPSVLLKYEDKTGSALLESTKNKTRKSWSKTSKSAKTSSFDMKKRASEKVLARSSSYTSRRMRELESEKSSSFSTSEFLNFSLEIYVVDNSWPLTYKEWKIVRKLREQGYIGNQTIQEEDNFPVLATKTASVIHDSKKSTLRKVEAINKPWYLLQYSYKVNSQMSLTKNKKDEEDLINLKKSWYENDPERYNRSFDLRQKNLIRYVDPGCTCPEEYYSTEDETSSLLDTRSTLVASEKLSEGDEEDDAERTTVCPKWIEAYHIPPFDLSPYYVPQCRGSLEFKKKYVKTEEDHIADKKERRRLIKEYNAEIDRKRQNMELWLSENENRLNMLDSWYSDCRKASEQVMEEYYSIRKSLIEELQNKRNNSVLKSASEIQRNKKRKN